MRRSWHRSCRMLRRIELRSKLMGRQQQARFGVRDSVDETNATQDTINRFETVGAQFRHDVPAAVRGVKRANRRIATQRSEYIVRVVTLILTTQQTHTPLHITSLYN